MRLSAALVAVLTTVGCCGTSSVSPSSGPPPYEVLDEVVVGPETLEFYVHYTTAAAVLGFAVTDVAGARAYCPMYASTYRGLPAVTVDVHASESLEEVWVASSWQGYESLAYHQLNSSRCVTRYGDHLLYSTPTPGSIGGSSAILTTFDPSTTTLMGTVSHDPNR